MDVAFKTIIIINILIAVVRYCIRTAGQISLYRDTAVLPQGASNISLPT